MFYEGQLVVCVDDRFSFNAFEWYDHTPKLGKVYTVRRVFIQGFHVITGKPGWGVFLCEIVNPPGGTGRETGFAGWRFKAYEDAASNIAYDRQLESIGVGIE